MRPKGIYDFYMGVPGSCERKAEEQQGHGEDKAWLQQVSRGKIWQKNPTTGTFL